MQKSIFFSWQSEIKPNRNLIEDCLKKAINNLISKDVHLDIAIDRDTIGSIGTVEIASTIFSKIDDAIIFIGDITLIGTTEHNRKVPNPNVLTELGYAANVLGWENIITMYNSNHGMVEELPFDIRHRRHIGFNALPNINNSLARTNLIKDLTSAIAPIIEKETIKESILNHFKLKVDETIFKICSSIYYLLFGYKKTFFLDELFMLLGLESSAIEIKLNKKLLGFAIFKEFGIYRQEIERIYENPKYSKFLSNRQMLNFIEISHCLENLERLLITNISKSVEGNENSLHINENESIKYPSLCKLDLVNEVKKVNKFIDAGYFRQSKKQYLLNYYDFGASRMLLTSYINGLLKNIDAVISSFGNSIIVDPSKIGEP